MEKTNLEDSFQRALDTQEFPQEVMEKKAAATTATTTSTTKPFPGIWPSSPPRWNAKANANANANAHHPLAYTSQSPNSSSSQNTTFPSSVFPSQSQPHQQQQQQQNQQNLRYLEILVHNVSHTDLVLSVNVHDNSADNNTDNAGGGTSTSVDPWTKEGEGEREKKQQQQPQPPPPPPPSHEVQQQQFSSPWKAALATIPDDPDLSHCLARPRFSLFDSYSRKVLDSLNGGYPDSSNIVQFPRYERSSESPRYSIKDQPVIGHTIATGFQIASSSTQLTLASLDELRIRGRDQARLSQQMSVDTKTAESLHISHVFFPLLATLLPRWQKQIEEKEYNNNFNNFNKNSNKQNNYDSQQTPQHSVKRVLVLVTGVGTPRNWTHSVTGNSTEACADVMERFLHTVDPDLTVVKIHSSTNIFRYDENLLFVERELMPVLNAYRDAHARNLPYPDEIPTAPPAVAVGGVPRQFPWNNSDEAHPFNIDWRKSMAVTLSFADGSPARTYAIQASLRPYRPTYFHFWQLKTFWHESKIVDDDIEVHSFESMETLPAVDAQSIKDPHMIAVVEEMKSFCEEMQQTLRKGTNDITQFWLRKTHKPVLAVLLVQSTEMAKPKLYRGINMEVSMPTGSLCAERNVIGTALAENPGLKREDLKMIAVLAVPLIENKVLEKTASGAMKRIPSVASYSSLAAALYSESGDGSGLNSRKPSVGSENDGPLGSRSRQPSLGSDPEEYTQPTNESTYTGVDGTAVAAGGEGSRASTAPVRRISLLTKDTSTGGGRAKQRTVIVQATTKDMNPLPPCGACNEWLKKIAESNPYFQILTFTDAGCNGVYCSPCHD